MACQELGNKNTRLFLKLIQIASAIKDTQQREDALCEILDCYAEQHGDNDRVLKKFTALTSRLVREEDRIYALSQIAPLYARKGNKKQSNRIFKMALDNLKKMEAIPLWWLVKGYAEARMFKKALETAASNWSAP